MSDASHHVRRPYQPSESEQKILNTMYKWGHKGYLREIEDITETFDLTVAEAGPGGNHCEVTQAKLDRLDQQIQEVIQSAVDRYDDWASDPLP